MPQQTVIDYAPLTVQELHEERLALIAELEKETQPARVTQIEYDLQQVEKGLAAR